MKRRKEGSNFSTRYVDDGGSRVQVQDWSQFLT